MTSIVAVYGTGSSVCIVTDYRLVGPGTNPVGDENFRQFRLALGPTDPNLQWVSRLSRGQIAVGACC